MARPKIPVRLLIIDGVGTVLAALGIAGLFTHVSGMFAFLADRAVSGVIAAIGFALVTFSLGHIFRWQKMVRAAQQQSASKE